ncbi:hypothetical protein M569_02951 [Genlisea aurea]|uniref:Uncharacterized protein n=1 Tax=Genlisea aurea TaxID=192259 RepID=S8D332_9LAMI|nr:hypothetical protein M569_02951 [Genlisea aurea]
MKKLYGRKGTVHPSSSVVSDSFLALLPAALLSLSAALSPGEREVLAYLISCTSANFSNARRTRSPSVAGGSGGDHPTSFNCGCFRCYMSYWVKWDSSPNRQVIHEILDSFEESLMKENRSKKERRRRRSVKEVGVASFAVDEPPKKPETNKEDFRPVEVNLDSDAAAAAGDSGGGEEESIESVEDEEEEEEELEKGSVRRFVSFLGERIWGVWG